MQVRDLRRLFDVSRPWLNRVIERQPRQYLRAVDHVSFSVAKGETLAIVGESGSGKSTVARMVVGLMPPSDGKVTIAGISMTDPRQAAERRQLRRRIQMIFQDPYASMNPRWRVDRIVSEPIRAFGLLSGEREIQARVGELLTLVGLHPDDGKRYPHAFSAASASASPSRGRSPPSRVPGRRRADLGPRRLGPAQILNLMRDLQDRLGLTYLFISHNLAVVRHMANRIGVMYLGRIVEIGGGRELFTAPKHPYTPHAPRRGPRPRPCRPAASVPVQGEIPNPINPPAVRVYLSPALPVRE